MSFPATTGILLPEDFKIVHQAYSEIAAEPWFTPSRERREQFALSVIDLYRRGTTNPVLLARQCREIAQREFGDAASRN